MPFLLGEYSVIFWQVFLDIGHSSEVIFIIQLYCCCNFIKNKQKETKKGHAEKTCRKNKSSSIDKIKINRNKCTRKKPYLKPLALPNSPAEKNCMVHFLFE